MGSPGGCSMKNFCAPPVVEVIDVADVAGVSPVCSQWSSVDVAGGLLVGMSRSTMMSAYELPGSWSAVPTVGCFAVAVLSISHSASEGIASCLFA